MGLYSTNRVCGLAPEVFTEEAYDPSFGSIMETSIQICENDQKMFDSLIECDFLSAHTEATMLDEDASAALLEQDEAKKKSIFEKIKELINAVINAIKKAASNFIAKLKNLIANDSKIYARYEKTLTTANLEGFKGIKNYVAVGQVMDPSKFSRLSWRENYKKEFIDKISSAYANKETINTAYDEAKKKLSSSFTNRNNGAGDVYFAAQVDSFVPSESDIQKMKSIMKSSNTFVNVIKSEAGSQINDLKKMESDAKQALYALKSDKNANELEVYKAKKTYDVTSIYTKAMVRQFNNFTNIAARQLAAARKGFLICGKYCYKKANGGNPAKEEDQATAEAVDFAVMESSDEYIFSELGY